MPTFPGTATNVVSTIPCLNAMLVFSVAEELRFRRRQKMEICTDLALKVQQLLLLLSNQESVTFWSFESSLLLIIELLRTRLNSTYDLTGAMVQWLERPHTGVHLSRVIPKDFKKW